MTIMTTSETSMSGVVIICIFTALMARDLLKVESCTVRELSIVKMPSGVNAIEMNDIQEGRTDARAAETIKMSQCYMAR